MSKAAIKRVVVKVRAQMRGRGANAKRGKRVLRQKKRVRERAVRSTKSRGRKKSTSEREGGRRSDCCIFIYFLC